MENLKQILDAHVKWVNNKTGGVCADLENANLKGAYLEGANLEGANLEGADLELAYLKNANLPIFCKWAFSVIDGKIQIGCKTKSIEEWETFFNSEEVYSTPRNTPEFKQIKAVYLAHKAYLEALK
jgi:hypothetical protein